MNADAAISRIASAIGEPARARMLYSLLDNRARTSTELAIIAGVSPSTASVHLNRLRTENLVELAAQGKHRYYSLAGRDVARALESLIVLTGGSRPNFVPNTPPPLRAARTCYDHIAGALGVSLHDRLRSLRWITRAYCLTPEGAQALQSIGIDLDAARKRRRKFAYACLDWSERRPHLAGSLGAAILDLALKRKWVAQHLDNRALEITGSGRRELASRLGLSIS